MDGTDTDAAERRRLLGIPLELAEDWEQTLQFFDLLYGDTGVRMLRAFFRAGNNLLFGSLWFEPDGFDVDWQSGEGSGGTSNVDVEISSKRSALEKAIILMQALEDTRHYWFTGLSDPTIEEYQKFFDSFVSYAADLVRTAAELELAGLTVINEGADWTMALHEASEGNKTALLALLPFVTVGMVKVVDRTGVPIALGVGGTPTEIRRELLRFFRRVRRGHGTELGLPPFAGDDLGTSLTRGRIRDLDGTQSPRIVTSVGSALDNPEAARAAAEVMKQELASTGFFTTRELTQFGDDVLKHAEGASLSLLRYVPDFKRAVLDINNNYICQHCWRSLRYLIPEGKELIVRLRSPEFGDLTFSFKYMEHPKLLLDGQWVPVTGHLFRGR